MTTVSSAVSQEDAEKLYIYARSGIIPDNAPVKKSTPKKDPKSEIEAKKNIKEESKSSIADTKKIKNEPKESPKDERKEQTLGNSSLNKNVTIKGGVVMMAISKDIRRATQDLDIDFIRYSLDDSAIEAFIEKLNDKDIKIKITSPIKRLHHQDYDGKRVFIDISDNFGNVFSTKLDVGVHKDIDIDQDELCFDLGIDSNSVTLLANSKEQICVEKIKSLLKFGITSTRYKDIFDIYYLINKSDFDKRRFLNYLDKLIFGNELIEENNITELQNNLKYTLSNKRFKSMVNMAKNNWLGLSIDDTVNSILDFISSLELVEV